MWGHGMVTTPEDGEENSRQFNSLNSHYNLHPEYHCHRAPSPFPSSPAPPPQDEGPLVHTVSKSGLYVYILYSLHTVNFDDLSEHGQTIRYMHGIDIMSI